MTDLVQAALEITPKVAARAEEARSLGRLTDDVVGLLEDAGLLGLLTPRGRGGAEASLATFVRVNEELAAGCGSTSWVTGIYAAARYMLSSFDDRAQDQVYGSAEHPKLLAAFQPSGAAAQVAGGYRLSGTWRFCSGQHHADWALLTSVTTKGVPAQFLLPRGECRAVDEWRVTGLSGTGSGSLAVAQAFVPEHRVLPLAPPGVRQSRSAALGADPYFGMPFIPLFVTGGIGTPLGLARAALELFAARVHERPVSYTPYEVAAHAPVTQLRMAEAAMALDQARFHAERAVATVAEVTADPANLPLRVRVRADAAWATRRCLDAVRAVRDGAGAGVIRMDDPLSRIIADVEALASHSFLLQSTNAELYGRVLCGLDPGVPFL